MFKWPRIYKWRKLHAKKLHTWRRVYKPESDNTRDSLEDGGNAGETRRRSGYGRSTTTALEGKLFITDGADDEAWRSTRDYEGGGEATRLRGQLEHLQVGMGRHVGIGRIRDSGDARPNNPSGSSGFLWSQRQGGNSGGTCQRPAIKGGDIRGGCSTSKKGGDITPSVGKEERRKVATMLGPAVHQQNLTVQEVQNGEPKTFTTNGEGERFHDFNRFKGWIPTCSGGKGIAEVSTVQTPQQVLQVSCATFRVVDGTQVVYKDSASNSTIMQGERYQTPSVFRRFYHPWQFGGTMSTEHGICFATLGEPGVVSEQRKVDVSSLYENRVSGFRYRYCLNAVNGTERQAKEIPKLLQATGQTGGERNIGQTAHNSSGTGEVTKRGPSSTFFLASSTRNYSFGTSSHSSQKPSSGGMGCSGGSSGSTDKGGSVVDRISERMEWKFHHIKRGEDRHLLRRVGLRLWRVHGNREKTVSKDSTRALDAARTDVVNQHQGIGGGRENSYGLPEVGEVGKMYSSAVYGQYRDVGVREQNGGSVPSPPRSGKSTPQSVRGKGGKAGGRACTRDVQQGGGCALKIGKRQVRLEFKSRNLQVAGPLLGSTYSGLVRNQEQQTTPTFRVMDSGLRGDLHRRVKEFTSKRKRVCKPTFRGYRSRGSETEKNKKPSHYHSTSMAGATLVAANPGINGGYTNNLTGSYRPIHTVRDAWSKLQACRPPMGSDRISTIRQLYQAQEISQEVSQVITSRWAPNTCKYYESIWKQWLQFTRDRRSNPVNPSIPLVLQFLMERFKANKTAASVNHAISALASVLNVALGEGFMQNQHVTYFRRACNIQKPTGPALVDIWDIALVFDWLRETEHLESWSLRYFLERVITLLRIDLFARSSDLTKIFREQILWESELFKIRFLKPKEWRPEGKNSFRQWTNWISVHKLSKEENLCSYTMLKKWLQITDKIAPRIFVEGEWRTVVFFKRVRGVTKPLSLQEISRISNGVLRKAGIPRRFTSQSLRSAASSAAADDGVPIEQILHQGRWSSKEIFKKYYYRSTGRSKKSKKLNLQEKLRQ